MRVTIKRFTKEAGLSIATMSRVLKALHDNGIAVPDNVFVIGIDNACYFQYPIPPLIMVRQPRTDMGKSATQLLMDRMMGDKKKVARKIILPIDIVGREFACYLT